MNPPCDPSIPPDPGSRMPFMPPAEHPLDRKVAVSLTARQWNDIILALQDAISACEHGGFKGTAGRHVNTLVRLEGALGPFPHAQLIKHMVATDDYVEKVVELRIRFTQADIKKLYDCAAEFAHSRAASWIRNVHPIPGSIGFTIDAQVRGQVLEYTFTPAALAFGLQALARVSEKDLPMSWQARHYILARFLEPWEGPDLGTRTACDLIYFCVKGQYEITCINPRPPMP